MPDTSAAHATDLPTTDSPPSVPASDPSYIVEVGGQRISQFGSLTAALSCGLTLKGQNAGVEVRVYDARERATA
ncbi:hypothetical protein [Undibacter mobilis]|uniref:Uncharacterized protein n=1 Tax=Undibacter mobilis TaxID=2292256 RepID=A0A371B2N6_9BRAD|nr:hypothetical protein [Undibacter mobilis]RDV01810.1 hypothetical protein DXH78_14335 [Undibacter mobilis]